MEQNLFSKVGNKKSLVNRVVEEIQNMILNGSVKPDSKLPPERDFAEQLGVSRTVIREAVQILTSKGLVTTKHGVGTIVLDLNNGHQFSEPLSLLMNSNKFNLDHIHQIRTILEVEIAALAAEHASEDQFSKLSEIVSEMEKHTDEPETFAKCDDDFHYALAETTDNPLLVILIDSIRETMQILRLMVANTPEIKEYVLPDHKRILGCIRERDAKGAQKAMLSHLKHARAIQKKHIQDQGL